MLNNTDYIEKVVIVSKLEADFIGADKRIRDFRLEPRIFKNKFHKKIAIGINRLVELNLPLDFEVLRDRFLRANKWSLIEDDMLIEIMTHNAFGSWDIFERYYKLLEEDTKIQGFSI